MRKHGSIMVNFDEIIERRNTDSLKYDFAGEFGVPEDAIPLWVADMDFKAPEKVLKALHQRVDHGIFGYSEVKQDYFQAVAGWFSKRFGWEPEMEWLVKSPGVVFAINHVLRACTKRGDAVLIQQPVYYPFAASIRNNERILVNNELVYTNGSYAIDFEDFERKIVDCQVKLFILCSPHNPVGRVWTREELQRMGEICLRHQVIVVSDEIHCDFTYEGHPHTVFAKISKEAEQNCIICTAPSKTFNLAGLQVSNMFIPDKRLRDKVKRQFAVTGYDEINTLGLTACKAAYLYGEDWLMELRQYLKGNLDYIREFLANELPRIRLVEPEGTYLAWLDCSALAMTDEELDEFMKHKARLWLDAGSMFGENSGQFVRVNMTCPRSLLKKAMEQLRQSV